MSKYKLRGDQMVALIDTDVIAYRACYAVQEDNPDFGEFEGEATDDRFIDMAMEVCEDIIAQWQELAAADKSLLCLSDRSGPDCTFRFRLFPEYKANRTDREKPTFLEAVNAKLLNDYESLEIPGLEGDDVMGIMHTHNPNNSVMVSIDKDMFTIPGLLVRPKPSKGDDGVVWDGPVTETSKREADWNWMLQTIAGDSVDGYKGVWRVGPVGAKKLLGPPGKYTLARMWKIALQSFHNAGMPTREAVTNARMARILRKSDYNFRTGTIKLFPGGTLERKDYLD